MSNIFVKGRILHWKNIIWQTVASDLMDKLRHRCVVEPSAALVLTRHEIPGLRTIQLYGDPHVGSTYLRPLRERLHCHLWPGVPEGKCEEIRPFKCMLSEINWLQNVINVGDVHRRRMCATMGWLIGSTFRRMWQRTFRKSHCMRAVRVEYC